MIKFDLFKEWLPSIIDGKVSYIYAHVAENDVSNEDFMILRALSQYQDLVGIANLANEKLHGKTPSKLLYDFLYYSIPKKRRFSGKWGKQGKKMAELEIVAKAFNCNQARAKEYVGLMTDEALKELVEDFTDFGGVSKKGG